MAGGNWTAQNKVRPGVYINFKSRGGRVVTQGSRGTLAACRALSWGPVGQMMSIESGGDPTPFIGYGLTAPQSLFMREAFKGTDVSGGPTRLLLYRLQAEGAAQASAALSEGGVTATALYPGVRGNDISVTAAEDVDETGTYTVSTLVDGLVVDSQRVKEAAELAANSWISFSGDTLAATAGISLSGGADGTVNAASYAAFLEALEPYSFDVLAYDGTDSTVRQAFAAFVQRISSQTGRYAQLVTAGADRADSRFVINCGVGVVLEDGEVLTPEQTVWWLAGAQAGAQYYQSLSCAAYPGAVDVSTRLTSGQIEEAIQAGTLVLAEEFGRVRVETDINTLTTFTPEVGEVFSKNAAMRVCNTLANDIYREFSLHFLGKVKNNTEGRGLFQAAVLEYLLKMYEKDALSQRPAGADVEVLEGDRADSLIVNLAFVLAGTVEKIYMTITVA